jgi:hypothetical protein
MNVAWLDLSNTDGWQGPVAFGRALFAPGTLVAMDNQSDTVLAALAVGGLALGVERQLLQGEKNAERTAKSKIEPCSGTQS